MINCSNYEIYQELKSLIQKEILNLDLKPSLINFLDINRNLFDDDLTVYDKASSSIAFIILIDSLKSKSLTNLNWNFLCEINNKDNLFLKLNFHLENINNTNCLHSFIDHALKSLELRGNYFGLLDFYKLFIDFYKYLYTLEEYNQYPNIEEISKYINLLITTSRPTQYILNPPLEDSDIVLFTKYVFSDFPLNSNYNNFITLSYFSRSSKTLIHSNYNLNIDNQFIKNILKDFAQYSKYNGTKGLYLFMYYFAKSFNDKIPNNYNDLNDNLFRIQFSFFKNIDSKYEKVISTPDNPSYKLIHFYRFLTNKIYVDSNEYIFSKNLTHALDTKNFNKYYSDGYEFLYHNKYESVPTCDKVCILPSINTLNNSNSRNNTLMVYDVSYFDNKYKQDIKEFIWYSNGYLSSTLGSLCKLNDFFNIKKDYESLFKKVSFIDTQHNHEFPDDFLYFYRSIIELDYPNPGSLKSVLKIIRKYLKFYKSKYKVTETHFNILNLKKLSNFDGGNPITDHDIDLIYKEFESREKQSNLGRLYTIVFELFIHTNLRIGSILNLTRDCLVYNNDGTTTLKYLSKTSNKEFVTQLINPTIVKLIEEAISITKVFIDMNINNRYSHYLFIHKYASHNRYDLKRIDFYPYFKNIVNSLSNDLDKNDYYPYNIRHTYMNNIFKKGASLNLDISEMSAIAGISYKTANLYYRDANDIDLYVEALSKVTISNVDIYGQILDSSKSNQISNSNPVKSGLGNCKLSGCDIRSGECFICFNFVTFTNRIPLFEKAILECDNLLKNSNNPIEKEFYFTQKKLLGAYLSKMLKINSL